MSLRPLTEPDLSLVRSWRNAPEVRRNMFSSHEISDSEHLAWFARMEKEPQSRWLLYENKFGIPEGVVYFTQISETTKNAFWGFYGGSNAQKGIGTRIEFEALDYAFVNLELHKLNCEVIAVNIGVLNLHKKFGFSSEGLFRDFHFNGIKHLDVVRLGILASEWAKQRNAMLERLMLLDQLQATNAGGGTQS